jgi:hypothetical protein
MAPNVERNSFCDGAAPKITLTIPLSAIVLHIHCATVCAAADPMSARPPYIFTRNVSTVLSRFTGGSFVIVFPPNIFEKFDALRSLVKTVINNQSRLRDGHQHRKKGQAEPALPNETHAASVTQPP